jgi:predicted nucleic-acid-binding protein
MQSVAVDTNLLVRLATGDDAREHRAVTEAFAARAWRVFSTVILETEWVLRSRYGFAPAQFADFVEWLQTSGRVVFTDADAIRAAVSYHREGLDFADALHIAQTDGEPFLTLDKALRRKAAKLGLRAEGLH